MFQEARLAEDKVAGFLEEEGAELVAEDGDLVGVDLVVCLGGDGTLLKCSSLFKTSVPLVLPFALGHENFFYTIKWDLHTAKKLILNLLGGAEHTAMFRQRLLVSITNPGVDARVIDSALNEVTVRRDETKFLADLNIYLNNALIFSIRGDGVIISTASGSSAYSLSAGGPLLHPTIKAMLVTPISSYPPSLRPVVVPAGETLSITHSSTSRREFVNVTLDYRCDFKLYQRGRIDVRMHDYPVEQVVGVEDDLPLQSVHQIWCSKVKRFFR